MMMKEVRKQSSDIFEMEGYEWCLKCKFVNSKNIILMLYLICLPFGASKVQTSRELYLKETKTSSYGTILYE